MSHKLFALLISCLISYAAISQEKLEGEVYFEYDKSEITDEASATLDSLYALVNNPHAKYSVVGHTDNIGGEQYNESLSQERALAVLNYFVKKGVSTDNVSYKGMGKGNPKYDNTTAEGRAKNRRVEVTISNYLGGVTVKGAGGVEAYIPENTYSKQNNQLQFDLFSPQNFGQMKERKWLAMTPKGECLEAVGMAQLIAVSGASSINPTGQKAITIKIPAKEMGPGFKLYKGIYGQDGSLGWMATSEPLKVVQQDGRKYYKITTNDSQPVGIFKSLQMEIPIGSCNCPDPFNDNWATDPAKSRTIPGPKGTLLSFSDHSFTDVEMTDITFEITEHYDACGLMSEGLTDRALVDDQQIYTTTGAYVNIIAKVENGKIPMEEDGCLTISFPETKDLEGYMPFQYNSTSRKWEKWPFNSTFNKGDSPKQALRTNKLQGFKLVKQVKPEFEEAKLKLRKFRNTTIFTYDQKNDMILRAAPDKKKWHYRLSKSAPADSTAIFVVAGHKKKPTVCYFEGKLSELKYKERRKKYKLKPRMFEEREKVSISSPLCE